MLVLAPVAGVKICYGKDPVSLQCWPSFPLLI